MPDSQPNVLFVFTDQQRPDWFSWNDDVPVRTPNTEALAERGVRFENAICPSPVCGPSRACFTSGMEYDRSGVRGNDETYPPDQDTIYRRLRDEAGYHVMGCGKIDIGAQEWDEDDPDAWDRTGQNRLEEWGFSDGLFMAGKNQTTFLPEGDPPEPADPYSAYLAEEGVLSNHVVDMSRRRTQRWTATYPTPLPKRAYVDEWITTESLKLLDGAPDDAPWYMQVNLQNPHHPWDVPEDMYFWYRDPDVAFPDPVNSDLDVTDEEHQQVRRNYAAMVDHIDTCLGRLIEKVDARGELENTVVVFSSDHGEMLGDHGQWQKLSPHKASIGVPLVMAGPGIEGRDPVSAPATILDLHATFLDWAGLAAGDVDSRSMGPFLGGEAPEPPRDVVFSGLSGWRLAFDGRFSYVEGYDPAERVGGEFPPMSVAPEEVERMRAERRARLFDVAEGETRNRIEDRPAVADRLSDRLSAHLSIEG